MKQLLNFSSRNPWVVIIIAVMITVIMGMGISRVTITEDREEFLPKEHTSYRVLSEYKESAGELITEAIMVEGVDLSSAQSFRQIEELTMSIRNHEELKDYIDWNRSYTGFLVPVLEKEVGDWENLSDGELTGKIDQLLARPEVQKDVKIYISEDRTGAVITQIINNQLPEAALEEKTILLHELTDQFERKYSELNLSNTGTISTDLAITSGIQNDLLLLIPIAAAFIIIVLYLTFRRALDCILPFIVLGMGAIWMVGTMGLLNIPFYANFTIIVPLLLGIGIDYTIHFLNRYYQEKGQGLDSEKAAVNSLQTVGIAIFLTALTTVIGFSSFGISDMPPIKSFGYVAGLGVFYVFILANTVLPSLLIIRDRHFKNQKSSVTVERDSVGRALMRLENSVFNYSKWYIGGTVILAILAIYPIVNLSTTMSSDIMMPKGAEAIETQKALEDYFRGYGSDSKAFIIAEGPLSYPESLKELENIQQSIINNPENENLIMGTTSLADLVKKETGGEIPQSEKELSKILESFKSHPDPKYGKILFSDTKTAINISYETDTMEEEREATEIIRTEINEISESNSEGLNFLSRGDPAVSGMPVVFSDISSSIKPDLVYSILFAVVLVIIVLAIIFKSLLLGFIGAVPVVLTLIWELGLLGAMNIPLNVMNMLVSAIAIGVGVDFTIHVVYRFKEEWQKKGSDPRDAISKTLQGTGRAISSAAITTIGVFLIISLSSSPMLISFGLLSALVIFLSFAGSLVVLPIILLNYARYSDSKS